MLKEYLEGRRGNLIIATGKLKEIRCPRISLILLVIPFFFSQGDDCDICKTYIPRGKFCLVYVIKLNGLERFRHGWLLAYSVWNNDRNGYLRCFLRLLDNQ